MSHPAIRHHLLHVNISTAALARLSPCRASLQVSVWRKAGFLAHAIPPERALLYQLLAGEVAAVHEKLPPMDWRRSLGMFLWWVARWHCCTQQLHGAASSWGCIYMLLACVRRLLSSPLCSRPSCALLGIAACCASCWPEACASQQALCQSTASPVSHNQHQA